MIRIGDLNRLTILEQTERGLVLDAEEEGELLLPLQEEPKDYAIGDKVEVFVYVDSHDALLATRRLPSCRVGDFAVLKVVAQSSFGDFLDWGAPKDLFLPFREQTCRLRVGDEVVVYIYLDNTGRICASMRTDKYASKQRVPYREGEAVDLLISGRTDLGYKAIVNNRHLGILYESEVFQTLREGQRVEGFIRKIREDGKIDLSLYQTSYKDSDGMSEKIIKLLEDRQGFLPVGDKTSAEVIYDLFGISKKKFKMALGNLYKQGRISLETEGIKLKN